MTALAAAVLWGALIALVHLGATWRAAVRLAAGRPSASTVLYVLRVAATAAALPPEEPPGEHSKSCGL